MSRVPDGWSPMDAVGLSTQIIVALVAQMGGTHRLLTCPVCGNHEGQPVILAELALPGGPTVAFPITPRSQVLADTLESVPEMPAQPSFDELAAWIRQSLGAA